MRLEALTHGLLTLDGKSPSQKSLQFGDFQRPQIFGNPENVTMKLCSGHFYLTPLTSPWQREISHVHAKNMRITFFSFKLANHLMCKKWSRCNLKLEFQTCIYCPTCNQLSPPGDDETPSTFTWNELTLKHQHSTKKQIFTTVCQSPFMKDESSTLLCSSEISSQSLSLSRFSTTP